VADVPADPQQDLAEVVLAAAAADAPEHVVPGVTSTRSLGCVASRAARNRGCAPNFARTRCSIIPSVASSQSGRRVTQRPDAWRPRMLRSTGCGPAPRANASWRPGRHRRCS
jgi:hypothetical protein